MYVAQHPAAEPRCLDRADLRRPLEPKRGWGLGSAARSPDLARQHGPHAGRARVSDSGRAAVSATSPFRRIVRARCRRSHASPARRSRAQVERGRQAQLAQVEEVGATTVVSV